MISRYLVTRAPFACFVVFKLCNHGCVASIDGRDSRAEAMRAMNGIGEMHKAEAYATESFPLRASVAHLLSNLDLWRIWI